MEVLDKQPAVVQELLMRTAILDRVCAALCAALLGEAVPESEGQAFLEHSERENLFIVPLDDADGSTGHWYRFHQLFRHFLHAEDTEELAQRDVAPAFIAAIRLDTGWVGPQPARAAEPQLAELLTFREVDVLRLLCRRMTNREIAHALSISPETVKEHTVHIYRKLQVHNRRQAVVRALALGLTPPA